GEAVDKRGWGGARAVADDIVALWSRSGVWRRVSEAARCPQHGRGREPVHNVATVGDVYDEGYYADQRTGSQRSARLIVPLLLELVQPRSVVDVGCGTGSWLSVFRDHGVEDVLGIDWEYVGANSLEISPDHFYAFDLTQPLRLERRFDLVVSLEVAEHLPPESADAFVESLVSLGPTVLFSAAVPGQGG